MHLDKVRTILCLGAHADDIEIGCGGTILSLLEQNKNVKVHWFVLSGSQERAEEAQRSAAEFLAEALESHVVVKDFRDGFFPYDGKQIKEFFFEMQREISPDLIFTHRREDLHQDHRIVSELTWNTWRSQLIMEYEIPKYEGDLGAPNVFVPLSERQCERKIEAIDKYFQSQDNKPWFNKNTFWSLLRIRGIEACPPSEFAEGLYCRKLTLNNLCG